MTELEKCNAGLEYSYADEELVARKGRAIRWCEEYNAIDGEDYDAQYAYLQKMLGSIGERVWIAKTSSLCELFTLQRYDFFIKNTGVVISVS